MYLNCHTAFSFKYGTLTPASLVEQAQQCGVSKLIVTEINNTASLIELLRITGGGNGPEIATGMEFREAGRLLYVMLAENNAGFEQINRFRSRHNASEKPLPGRAPLLPSVFIIYPFGSVEPATLHEQEFIGIHLRERNRFRLLPERTEYSGKYVILHPVTFSGEQGFEVHRLLRAIDANTLLSKLTPGLVAGHDEQMIPEGELLKYWADFPEMIETTRRLVNACTNDLQLGVSKNKSVIRGSREEDWRYLVEEATTGFRQKYDATNPALIERFERELRIIREKDFCAYYLIALDLIRFADEQGSDHIGRGSGANSMVAYCLGITNVDPVVLDLYFERFLNPERSSPPDFDLDFSWDQRDAIYEYLFRRYGHEHVCLLGTHTTLQERSAVRELGKVFGLPKEEIDLLADDPGAVRHRDAITEKICHYADLMKELPLNLSIHAGGVLITEKPIYAWTATDIPPKGYPVSHFEMHNAEDAGIYKLDVLSQRGLGHLRETVRLVKENRGIAVDIDRFHDFRHDPEIRSLLREGRTMGCFYVESPAMRMLLKKLRCEDYITLVAASSIIRPGVARSGMMRAYIERFHLNREGKPWPSVHPVMAELLAETYGVMVYQEDVIRVAHHFAGLSLAEADVLRRGLSGKYRSRKEFDKIRLKFFTNCRDRGYAQEVTDRVWYEVESFSGYSFAKGHSASYAVESYQSLYLKAHYPLEFMTGVINNFGGFYRTEFYFHEARHAGAIIEPPCVNQSGYLTTINGNRLLTGFIHLSGLENKIARLIAQDRTQNGDYRNLADFIRRIPIGPEQIRLLIRAGAFRFT
ncbi:MAG: DNA polymerase III subunit alpha, partial [Bacteroidota bacterium]